MAQEKEFANLQLKQLKRLATLGVGGFGRVELVRPSFVTAVPSFKLGHRRILGFTTCCPTVRRKHEPKVDCFAFEAGRETGKESLRVYSPRGRCALKEFQLGLLKAFLG